MHRKEDDRSSLFFVAIIPPSPIYEEVLGLKQYVKERYNSKAALNSPPHITLHMPFRWKLEKENILIASMRRFVSQYEPIKICIDDFSCFEPRVLFMNVTKSLELERFQKDIQRCFKVELNLFNANYREEPYHPHVTLAFRDLKKSAFKDAWSEFSNKEYKAEFVADKISLLKHNGAAWQVHKEFLFSSSFTAEANEKLETTEG